MRIIAVFSLKANAIAQKKEQNAILSPISFSLHPPPVNPLLCVVIPAFNEEAVLAKTHKKLDELLSHLITSGEISNKSFICFVDDGSSDDTWAILSHLVASYAHVSALKLTRNYGHQSALLAGLEYVSDKCDCAISIDCDLQQDEQKISEFLQKYKAGADIVLGIRNDRVTDSVSKKYSALLFYKIMNLMGTKVVKNHADYRLLSARALQILKSYPEVNLFLRGVIMDMGLKQERVYFDVKPRFAGESKYSWAKMLSFAWSGITSFSIAPLRLVSMLGLIFFLFSLCYGGYVLFIKFFTQKAIFGWASTILPLCFFSGIQLLSLGIIGEYIGKIYAESKHRPRYYIESILTPKDCV